MAVGSNPPAYEYQRWLVRGRLAENITTGPNNGQWIRVYGFPKLHVTLGGSFTGDARILGCASTTKPSDSDNNWPLVATALTAAGSRDIITPCEFIKLFVNSVSGGTLVSCDVIGVLWPS